MNTDKEGQPKGLARFIVLVVVSVAMFGNYYIYDSISPLADVLKGQLSFSDKQIGLLNAIYSIPNIFMVLVGGIIVDRIGTRLATLVFTFVCAIGAGLTASSSDFFVMASGRLIFGLGAESMIVAVTTAIAKWFRGKELSFAFGLNLTLARLGSFAALNSPSWAKPLYSSWQKPLLLASLFGFIALAGAIMYFVAEKKMEGFLARSEEKPPETVRFRDIFSFGGSFWLVVALCVTFYSGIFPFQTFAIKFFMHKHGVSREEAGFLSSMLTLFAMICTPIFGFVVDQIGRRSLFMMFGSLLLIPVYLMLAYTDVNLYVPMAMMGTAFSLVPAIMWPSVAYIVGQEKLGTAYGLMTMLQNIGLAFFNITIGAVNDAFQAGETNPSGYNAGMWVFSALGYCAFLFAFLLWKRERGPHAHGLETITARSKKVEKA
jgi:MFS family permease